MDTKNEVREGEDEREFHRLGFPQWTYTCARVLENLAFNTSVITDDFKGKFNKIGQDNWSSINWKNSSDFTTQKELREIAISILLDSTSPGPDPLALQELGWAYGMGGGGGMGDWNGCHYVPNNVKHWLISLQKNEDGDDIINGKVYGSNAKRGMRRSMQPTRFCTIGGLYPYTKPYTRGGLLWTPSIAGVCVPSICTANSLYILFGENEFRDKLLNLAAAQDRTEKSSNTKKGVNIVSRQYRYIHSLSQSFSAGRTFQKGVVCEGETGLYELDNMHGEGYNYTNGYYGTLITIWVLLSWVVLGTVITSWKYSNHPSQNNSMVSDENKENVTKTEVKNGVDPVKDNDEYISNKEISHHLSTHSDGFRKDYGSYKDNDQKLSLDRIQKDSFGLHIEDSSQIDPLITSKGKKNSGNKTAADSNHHLGSDSEETEITPFIIYSTSNINLEMDARTQKLCPRYVHEPQMIIIKLKRWIENICMCFDAKQSFRDIMHIRRIKLSHASANTLNYPTLFNKGDEAKDFSLRNLKNERYHDDNGNINTKEKDEVNKTHKLVTSMSSSKCLNGLRSISMLWIILGHTAVVQSSLGYTNPAAFLPPTGMLSSPLGMIILTARYAVDTFFFISGYLIMSDLLKRLDPLVSSESDGNNDFEQKVLEERVNLLIRKLSRLGIVNPNHVVLGDFVGRLENTNVTKETNSKTRSKHLTREKVKSQSLPLKWYFPFLLHRLMRILPTYGFVLLLWWKIAVMLGEGPFWPHWATFVAQCDTYAWTNLFFINNLVPWVQPLGETSECMYHSWYLAVDFQICAVLTPIFLSLYLKQGKLWRKLTLIIEIFTVMIIIVASLTSSYLYDWSGFLFDGAQTLSFDQGFYISPLFRASPYIIGFVTAQIWHEKCRLCPRIGLSQAAATILSFISIMLMIYLSSICGVSAYDQRPCLTWERTDTSNCGSGWSKQKLAVYNSFFRPVWGMGIAMISLLSFNGQFYCLGLHSVLTWEVWDPVGNLSFTMYLLHPLIINICFLGRSSKFNYSHVGFIYDYAGIVTMTLVIALIVGILVERPMSKIAKIIEKALWSSNESPKRYNIDKKNQDLPRH